ncbi:hypothetical protein CTAYLR_001762 [Chrysophaeum taylorii]|uniref:Uncharacterized protein n=1 Tax=Chrysophaeum taylorii TaxID=2483200 RepID=A0AAD7UEZ7_9STRA|nr:hypothetical protein CTAYLR_001762 [Chrysophaeum taylorii]
MPWNDDELLLRSLGAAVSTEQAEEHRVLAARLAESAGAPELGEVPEVVEGGSLFPAVGLSRLGELAANGANARRALKTCLRGRQAEGDDLGVALVKVLLAQLGGEDPDPDPEEPRLSKMEHKRRMRRVDDGMARAPEVPKKRVFEALPRSEGRAAWEPLGEGEGHFSKKKKKKKRRREEEEEEEEEDSEDERSQRREAIIDDADERLLRERLERALEDGELGESEDEGNDSGLRPRIASRLFPHQMEGIEWLRGLHARGSGGIVGDEMGLGKTALVSAFLGSVFDASAASHNRSAIVIAPTTMLAHWRRELGAWAPRAKVVVLHRSAKAFDDATATATSLAEFLASALEAPVAVGRGSPSFVACVASYDALHRLGDALLAKRWGYVVLDEGQKIRNPEARVTHLCKRFRTPRRLLLSGTPVQNSLTELWSLFDFACPGELGTLETFDAELAAPIRAGGYKGASRAQVELAYRCALALRELIRPFLLRRTKAVVCATNATAALPPKTEHVVFCRLSRDQIALYQEVLESEDVLSALAASDSRRQTSAFRAIANLRKICNHPDLYAGVPEDDDAGGVRRSGKLQALDAVLRSWRDQRHRALVFSQSVKMLDLVEALVKARRWRYARIDGTTSPAARQATADDFNAPTSKTFVMLLTTRTGGVGMSLVGADRVVLYDPDWNPQTDAQARERAWRLGQTKPVTVYRFIAAGTIEEKIYHRQIFKQALTNKVLSSDPKQRRLFTKSELADLFSLGTDAYPPDDDGNDGSAAAARVVANRVDDDDEEDDEVLTALWDGHADLSAVFGGRDRTDQPALSDEAEAEARRAVRAIRNEAAASRSRRGPVASADILSAISRRNRAAADAAANEVEDDGADAKDYSLDIVRRLTAFFDASRTPPATPSLLAEFSDVQDPLLFRSILRQLADLDDGRWIPKDASSRRRR